MDDETLKAGRRHSQSDQDEINQIVESAIKLGADHPRLKSETLAETIMGSKPLKFDGDYFSIPSIFGNLTIKAAGDWQLDVLGIPFGGPNNGKDSDGQYFSNRTKTYFEYFPSIPVFYYHGYNPDRSPQGTPEVIGTAKYSRTDESGHWFKVSLNKASEFAKRVWDAALKGIARASSGAIAHLVRIAKDGEILQWATAELSLFDAVGNRQPANAYAVAMPAAKAKNLSIPPELLGDNPGTQSPLEASNTQAASDTTTQTNPKGTKKMDEQLDISKLVAAEFEKQAAIKAAAEKQAADEAARVEAAVKAEREKWEAEAAKGQRLPSAPYQTKYADTNKFDGLDAGDTAVLIGALQSAKKPISDGALKALAVKLSEDKGETGREGVKAMKMAGMGNIKANEIEYSTLSNYGDEWIGVAYSTALWESIRLGTFVLGKLPQVEVPQGFESIYLPLESTDPTWYKVAESSSSATGYAGPTPTVTASLLGTGRVQMTLGKLGARVVWTGEMEEGSLIPFANQLRNQLAVSGAEYLESAIIDGDTETGASTNINDIDGTPAATDWFLVWNGFRKSPLITTAANSRSAAGSLDITDYLETVKLMGTGGKNAIDRSKVSFIVDPLTHYKTLTLPEVLTRDVFSSPTLEGGRLTGLFGYGLDVSGQMCKNGGNGLSEATGKVDETTGDNAYGQILAVRWDQWKFGWRRRMTMETTRWAASDSTEIVAMVRCGLIQRDTEASAITYYVGV